VIRVKPSELTIEGQDDIADFIAGAVCSYKLKVPTERGRFKDITMSVRNGNRIPVGMLDAILEQAGPFDLDVVDERNWDALPYDSISAEYGEMKLYPDQLLAIQKLVQRPVGVIKASTGSGKSVLANALVLNRDIRWMVIVHRENLLEDLKKTYLRMGGRDPGTIKAGVFNPKRVTFVMQTTLRAHLLDPDYQSFLESVEGIVCDECHSAGGDGYRRCLEATPNAVYRYGLSATPYSRSDGSGKVVEAVLGQMLCEVSTESLMELERVARFKVYAVKFQHEETTKRTAFSYAHLYDKAIGANPRRDLLLIDCARVAEKPSIVFCKTMEHALTIAQKLRKFAGLHVKEVTGKSNDGMREQVQKELNSGKIDVLVATKVFYEGANMPYTASVIDAGGGKSQIETIQKAGRGARRPEGKESCEIWTIYDEGWETFTKHSRARIEHLRKEGHSVNICTLKEGVLDIEVTLPPKV
jgi:superfamily II DNA or RNA helicase